MGQHGKWKRLLAGSVLETRLMHTCTTKLCDWSAKNKNAARLAATDQKLIVFVVKKVTENKFAFCL